ncbi:DnaJ domain-containing protein [Aestuariirhabdus sp. LZHN29]|uniref:DnaJ domain-containing protein n=1 Tax=Aestuariirhabdus sp. LZHN29 TaxID=3417462 RepID=UPI003CF89394
MLRMTLDQGTGEMDGEILVGRHRGAKLSELDFDAILNLYNHCPPAQQDTLRLLQGYLEKMHQRQWREYQGSSSATDQQTKTMGEIDAYRVLGLDEGASRQQIIDAHRRLISRVHPDKGGSAYLAAELNAAKEKLLGESGR